MDRQTLSDTFPIHSSKQGDAKSPPLSTSSQNMCHQEGSSKQGGKEIGWDISPSDYIHDVNLLGKNIKNNKEALLLASKVDSLIMVHII